MVDDRARDRRRTKVRSRASAGQARQHRRRRTFYRFSIIAVQVSRCISTLYVHKFGRPANAWRILVVIGRYAPVSASDVARLTVLESDKTARLLSHLVAQGFVNRRQEQTDRRRVVLTLTRAGIRAYEWLEEIRDRIDRELLASITAAEHKILDRLLDQLELKAKMMLSSKQSWRQFL